MARINDETTYYDRASSYCSNTMYEDGLNVNTDVGKDTIPLFNALPKVLSIVADLTIGTPMKVIEDGDFIDTTLKFNEFETKKSKFVRELLLGKSILVESILSEEANEVEWIVHNANQYEAIKNGNKVVYAKIVGDLYRYNAEEEKFEVVEVTKTYIDNEGSLSSKTVAGDEVLEEKTYVMDRLPLVEVKTAYDLSLLMHSIDRFNQVDGYINSVFYYCGEPILSASGVSALNEEGRSGLSEDRYKTQKVLYSGYDTNIQLLEVKGTSTGQMIAKQKEIIENLSKDYPEYSLKDTVQGDNISSTSLLIKLKEIMARVGEVRVVFKAGVLDLLEVAAMLKGTTLNGTVDLGDAITADSGLTLANIQLALANGLISKQSAMVLISDMYLDKDVEAEVLRMEKEGSEEGGTPKEKGEEIPGEGTEPIMEE